MAVARMTVAVTNVRGASAGALPSAEPSRQGRPADHLKLMEQQLCALLDAHTGRTAAERGRGLPPKRDPDPALRTEYVRLHAEWLAARAQGSLL